MTQPASFHPLEMADPEAIKHHQRAKLSELLELVRRSNPFYQAKLAGIPFDGQADRLGQLPFTTRAELQQSQADHPPYGTNLSFPLENYSRFHQTSGTNGKPMRWIDTAASWQWVSDCWCQIFSAAGVGRGDRVLFPFSFGPFLGFWAAFDAAVRMGALSIPAGGTSTSGRLQLITENAVTVICCTPTYAMHLAEATVGANVPPVPSPADDWRQPVMSEKMSFGPGSEVPPVEAPSPTTNTHPFGSVRAILVAGEPGGSIPEVRQKIGAGFPHARVFDHHGMTEMGPVSFECLESPGGVHINEAEFIPEVINPGTGIAVAEGEEGELVLTNLGRTASPLIRYRTGDRVRLSRMQCDCGRWYARLVGGILGRADDMFTVRGNNVFPTAVEAIVRRFAEIAEYRLTVFENGPLAEVRLEIEPALEPVRLAEVCRELSRVIHDELHFRAEVVAVGIGTLPRFEMKAKRFIRQR